MSRLWGRISNIFRSRTLVGTDKAGNRYFTRREAIDGIMKEKRWVVFKGEDDSTSIPVEWISWLNGQRRKALTPEEVAELEARRELVKLNVALLKKKEEERAANKRSISNGAIIGKVGGPDLKSFIQQVPIASEGGDIEETFNVKGGNRGLPQTETNKTASDEGKTEQPESSEPTGSGQSFRPGTWQPPT